MLSIYIVYYTGCRSSAVNMEARPADAKMITRRCIVARLQEMSISKYRDLIQENAGALLILLPQNLSQISDIDRKVGANISVASTFDLS